MPCLPTYFSVMTSHLHLLHTRRTEGQNMFELHHQRRQLNNSVWSFSCFFPIRAAVALYWFIFWACAPPSPSVSLSAGCFQAQFRFLAFSPPPRLSICPVLIFPTSPKSIGECIADYVMHSSTSAQTETQGKRLCKHTQRGAAMKHCTLRLVQFNVEH